MKLKKKQKETILLPTNADINHEKCGPSAIRRITHQKNNKQKDSLAGWQGAAQRAARGKQGVPCHFFQGLPGCYASSVLSLDIRSRSGYLGAESEYRHSNFLEECIRPLEIEDLIV